MTEKTLAALATGEVGTVMSVMSEASMRRRFYDIGLFRGAEIRMIGISPFDGPHAYAVCGAMIAIRQEDAEKISVRVENR